MKQEERRKQTIQLLLDTTKALIKEKGCHSLTMKDIMEKSGLSKGAIFHYVRSKDEIFAWVLQERLEETHARFLNEVQHGPQTFEGPMQQIVHRLPLLEDPEEMINQVLLYLIGKKDEPAVANVLKQFYELAVQRSKQWIETGQQHQVIPPSVDPGKTAELFVLLSLGLRVRSAFPLLTPTYTSQDFSSFMIHVLQSGCGLNK
ncbi:TetR/AcrR family transcriptional regulator [Brevibacillus fulvus]|uniref:AcrR family transcriptional regulator n=1 Tax=Brevibacillus fulvus TaxID=1125967 RepID=A0A938XV46_9BACL|nr:TetR/AcrR family transcriptional regulator [Brevibacillus fulvus]MBM7590677.1 AcrR family transcriptional regulator [Brevibacillus fulvus]